jgi:GT2 family glycosyltransferase
MNLRKLATRANDVIRTGGLGILSDALPRLRRRRQARRDYIRWIETHEAKSIAAVDVSQLRSTPLISIILPVYNVEEKWLRLCLDSVTAQIYPTWELCIADDASTAAHIRPVIEEYAARDARIKVVFRETNGHISAASNSALELATGEFTALLDHDDELSRDALFRVAREIDEFPDAAVIYSDEDLIDERGNRSDPKFKPDFSRDLFYSFNLVTHLSVFRTELLRAVGGFRVGFEGSQDYDLALRVLERVDETQIRHIPRVLYHWRTISGSVAHAMDEKPYAHERARAAIREHFQRTGVDAEVTEASEHLHRVSYAAGRSATVKVISVEREPAATPANLNSEASGCEEDVLVFLDEGLIHPSSDDIADLAGFAMQPGVGAVSGRVLVNDRVVEEAGLVLSEDLKPRPAHRGLPADAPGNMSRNRQISNYSAISISCFAIRRELFEEMGGFDPSVELFDLDLCLRLRDKGKRIVVLPHVRLARVLTFPARPLSPAGDTEFHRRWQKYSAGDPFCNANLKRDGSFEIDV